jgi:predicted transcriptional regulator
MKLEMLNDMLQEKLLKRDGNLLSLERTIMEREELIRELAEKLIVANLEKEGIFNEYEKILQTIVFHQEESNFAQESNFPQEGNFPQETPINSPI